MVLGHLKVKSLDTLLISLNFKVVLGTGLVFIAVHQGTIAVVNYDSVSEIANRQCSQLS